MQSGNLTAQDRKEQKRREAEFRQRTQPIRKQLSILEKKLASLSNQLAQIEQKLADSDIYDHERKSELNDYLRQQKETKLTLEEIETEWLAQQEVLENIIKGFECQQ